MHLQLLAEASLDFYNIILNNINLKKNLIPKKLARLCFENQQPQNFNRLKQQ